VNGAALIRYHVTKTASGAAHRVNEVKSTRDKTITLCRAGQLLRDTVVNAPPFRVSTFVPAPAISNVAGVSTDLSATGNITLTLNGSGVTGHFAISHLRRSHRISVIDRGVLWECAGTIVPVGVNTIDAVDQPYGVFDQPDWYVGSSGGHHEALRTGSS
jgi:hypothetical protein